MADLGRTLHMVHEASRLRWHRLHGLSAKNQNPGGAPLENWRSGARQAMEQIISKIICFLVAACTATTVALMVGDISHYDLGFSSLDIREISPNRCRNRRPAIGDRVFEKNPRKHK